MNATAFQESNRVQGKEVKMNNSELMTIEDIAEMHSCTMRHARDTVVKMPGFPEEAPTSRPRHKLWIRAEVKAFVTRKPARIPHKALEAA